MSQPLLGANQLKLQEALALRKIALKAISRLRNIGINIEDPSFHFDAAVYRSRLVWGDGSEHQAEFTFRAGKRSATDLVKDHHALPQGASTVVSYLCLIHNFDRKDTGFLGYKTVDLIIETDKKSGLSAWLEFKGR